MCLSSGAQAEAAAAHENWRRHPARATSWQRVRIRAAIKRPDPCSSRRVVVSRSCPRKVNLFALAQCRSQRGVFFSRIHFTKATASTEKEWGEFRRSKLSYLRLTKHLATSRHDCPRTPTRTNRTLYQTLPTHGRSTGRPTPLPAVLQFGAPPLGHGCSAGIPSRVCLRHAQRPRDLLRRRALHRHRDALLHERPPCPSRPGRLIVLAR